MKGVLESDLTVLEKFNGDKEKLLNLADNMAAAASMFSAHGYDNFIHSREAFMKTLHEHFIDFVKITHPES